MTAVNIAPRELRVVGLILFSYLVVCVMPLKIEICDPHKKCNPSFQRNLIEIGKKGANKEEMAVGWNNL